MFRARRLVAAALALVAWVVPPVAGAGALPEGNTGIAAGYPDDVGIEADPGVVFHEDFEAVLDGSLMDGNSSFDSTYGENVITTVPANVNGGTRAVERTHTNNDSFGAVKYLGVGYDTLHLRYYMKYHPLFPGCHHTGGGIYAAAGSSYTQIGDITGVVPDGTNHFQVWLDDMAPFFTWGPAGNDTPPGWTHVYSYNMDQGSMYGDLLFPDGLVIPGSSGVDFGAMFEARPVFLPERDRWYSFEIMLRANTPGASDGRIAFWVDGELIADFPNMLLRTTDSLKLNHVAISTYSSAYHDNKTLWYDDVVAATSYIGPMVSVVPMGTDAGSTDGGNGADGGTSDDAGGSGGEGDPGGGCGCRIGIDGPAPTFSLGLLAAVMMLAFRRPRRRRLRSLPGWVQGELIAETSQRSGATPERWRPPTARSAVLASHPLVAPLRGRRESPGTWEYPECRTWRRQPGFRRC